MKHYEVISPEMTTWSSYEPPEVFRCWGIFLAPTAKAAKVAAVGDREFAEWVDEQRASGQPPFKGLTVRLALCEHGHCYGCEPGGSTCDSDGTDCDACNEVVDLGFFVDALEPLP